MKKLHRRAVLVGLVVLTLSRTVGSAAASGAGKVTIFPGTGIDNPAAIAAGPDGALWFTNQGNNSIGRITTAGAVTTYTDRSISKPYGIAAGPDGALWFTNYGNSSIGRITTAGQVTNHTGTSPNPSSLAPAAHAPPPLHNTITHHSPLPPQ